MMKMVIIMTMMMMTIDDDDDDGNGGDDDDDVDDDDDDEDDVDDDGMNSSFSLRITYYTYSISSFINFLCVYYSINSSNLSDCTSLLMVEYSIDSFSIITDVIIVAMSE